MKLLLFGKNGQIGNFLKNKLNKNKNFFSVSSKECDFLRPEQIEKKIMSIKPDVIINTAAYTNVRGAEIDKKKAFQINSHAVKTIANCSSIIDARLIHFSTDYVYDGKKSLPYNENDKINPINTYGKSKANGDQAIILSGCRYVIIRTSWVFSENNSNFVLNMIDLFKNKKIVEAVVNQTGYPTSAEFLADCTIKIIKNKTEFNGVLNITNKGKTNWYEFCKFISKEALKKRLISEKVKIFPKKYVNRNESLKRPENSCLNSSKFQKLYNYEIKSWKQELIKVMNRL